MSDPVASRSGFLCTYMSNHPDTLVAYVRHFGKVNEVVESATMTSISTKEMSLSYIIKASKEKKTVNVPFNPPLAGYDEVKPRLLSMKVDAEESLGMVKRPKVTTFQLGSDAVLILAMTALLIYTTWSVPRPYPTIQNFGPWLRGAVGGPSVMRKIWFGVTAIHTCETLYAVLLCWRHSTSFGLSLKWIVATFILGMPALRQLRKAVQKARIDSIEKMH